jgi:hypothetical protein
MLAGNQTMCESLLVMNETNNTATKSFFAATDAQMKNMVLAAVATRYGITTEQALEKVTDEKAKSLLDYLSGGVRSAVAISMRGHKIS